MNTHMSSRYFFFGMIILALALVVRIWLPFLPLVVLSASLAVIFYPLNVWINKKCTWQSGWLGAALSVVAFIVVVFGPLVFLGTIVVRQATDLYTSLTNGGATQYIAQFNATIGHLLPDAFTFTVQEKLAALLSSISTNLAGILTATLNTLFMFLLLLLSLFYFIKDGAHWKNRIIQLSPLDDADDRTIIARLHDAVIGVFRGYLLIALAQGFLAGLGLALFGVPHAALFGLMAGFASFIPSVGTSLVCVPIVIFLFATGDTNAAIGFGIWSAVIVGTIDNILNPILVGIKINIPPMFILFSVLGGISLLGPIGILIGPLSLSFLHTLFSLYFPPKNSESQ